MSPGLGLPAREFTGLEEPPVLQQDRPGSFFTLHASQLSSLNQGSAISYRGLSVGEIMGYTLNQQNQKVDIYAFIRAPYDRLVHLQTRFWNASGLDVSLGAQGIRLAASSWQELLSGGVEFSTPSAEMNSPRAPKGTQFRLYDDKNKAEEDPRGTALMYQVDFTEAVHGIERGTAVELLGKQIGQVASVQLEYDDATHILHTPVLLAIDPTRVKVANRSPRSPAEVDLEFSALMEQWVEHGLRARLSAASLLTGQQIVSLDMVPGVPKARIKFIGSQMQLPTAPSLDVAEILRSVHSILEHIDSATAGPELKHAVKSLDETLTHLEHITSEVEPDIKPLIRSLRQTADAAQRTMQQAGNALGSNAPQGTDLPKLMQELTDAARSVRALADYLDQHPEALIRGRKQEDDK
jgi:paraquat-inducible protein B